jgi:ABC-type oligopeptide transport system ATPase subunit
MIKLENLTKQFAQKRGQGVKAVDNVNLNVPEGEMCVLLGPSGCGKTTTLKMINRLITPSSGKILINGEDTSEMDTVSLLDDTNPLTGFMLIDTAIWGEEGNFIDAVAHMILPAQWRQSQPALRA